MVPVDRAKFKRPRGGGWGGEMRENASKQRNKNWEKCLAKNAFRFCDGLTSVNSRSPHNTCGMIDFTREGKRWARSGAGLSTVSGRVGAAPGRLGHIGPV